MNTVYVEPPSGEHQVLSPRPDDAGLFPQRHERAEAVVTRLLHRENTEQSLQAGTFQSALSIVVPTRNEQDGIQAFLHALKTACARIQVEVIIVDDSDDDTPHRVRAVSAALETPGFSLRLLHRRSGPDRAGGLATAVQAGMSLAQAPYVAVIDADLQHPPEQLVRLYQAMLVHDADIVMGSRYRPGGDYAGLAGWTRRLFSHGLKQVTQFIFPEHLLRLTDPLGGLFLIRRSLVEGVDLRPIGYKISLELLLRTPWLKLVEVPYAFQPRSAGDSKADRQQGVLLLRHIARLFWSIPSAAAGWKITLWWLAGAVLSLVPFYFLHVNNQSLWVAWLTALETLLLTVAGGSALNADHVVRPLSVVKRWVASHWQYLIPIGIHAVLTMLLAQLLHSWYVALGIASLGSLAALHLLNTAENPRWVLYTQAANSLDETMSMGRIDTGGRTLTVAMTAIALLTGVAGVALEQLGPFIVVPTLILGAAFVLQSSLDRTKAITVSLAAATSIAAIDYAFWRVSMTNWSAWYVAIPLLLAEALGMLHTLGMQWTLWPRKPQRVRLEQDPTRRPIYVFIPTVNEGVEVLEPTVLAARAAREHYLKCYPHGRVEIVLCNDGLVAHAANWRDPERLARQLGVKCITRRTGGGAKAGNIEHARQQVGAVGDALIVIFDADQVAHRNFLVDIVAPFIDSEIGWVQSGQYYRNLENPVARWAHDQQMLFYHLLCPGKESLDAAFMCGTNLMICAAALDEIGGLPQDSVTEDFAASIALHPRWRSIYLPQELAVGLGPLDLVSYFKQQRRWAIGTLSVLRTHWRQIFLPRRGGLRFQQRLQYLLGCTHYLCGIRDLVYVVAPLVYVCFGVSAVKNGTMTTYLWHFLPYWLVSMSAFVYAAWRRTGWRGVVIGFASFPTLTAAFLSVLVNRRGRFAVTAKRRGTGGPWHVMIPHVLAWTASVAALIWNWHAESLVRGPAFFVEMWLAYITLMLTLSLWLAAHDLVHDTAWWRAWRSASLRVPRRKPAVVGARFAQETTGRVVIGLTLGLISVASIGLLSALATSQSSPTVIPVSAMLGKAPYLGIAGPTTTVTRDLPALQSQLHAHFSIVGRTQNVTDPFDRDWAGTLSARDAYPWITIQFGQYQPDGVPSLDASVTAIANGVHDDALARLAQEIHEYGKPVFITILPNVDRDWSLTSAVANGGIPADVPRAWQHVRSLFRAAGARNVAWVWAPKDPAHDDLFAPPDGLIDLVLVNVTYNPAGLTDSPVLIHEVLVKHPGKPMLVEVTTVESDAGELPWLQQVAEQVEPVRNIAGVIYYDGQPGQTTRSSQGRPDVQAIQAMWQWATRAPSLTPTATVTSSDMRTAVRTRGSQVWDKQRA